MKSTDVRIGNLLQRPGSGIVIVDKIEPHGFSYTDIEGGAAGWNANPDGSYIEGVTLTPEWLKRAGFSNEPFKIPHQGAGRWIWSKNGIELQREDSGYWIGDKKIEYVHQLQNHYADNLGKELEINVPVA